MAEVGVGEGTVVTPRAEHLYWEASNLANTALKGTRDTTLSWEQQRLNAEGVSKKTHDLRRALGGSVFENMTEDSFTRVGSQTSKHWGLFYNYKDGSLYEGPTSPANAAEPDRGKIKPIQDSIPWAEHGPEIVEALWTFIERQSQRVPAKV